MNIAEMKGMFFTNEDEMLAFLEENNFDVISIDFDSIEVIDITESDDEVIEIELVRANKTIAFK